MISGRAPRDLAVLSRLPAEVHLVGSHGSEFDIGFVHGLTPAQKELHEKLRIELGALVDGRPGVYLEIKPASIAVHLRQASAEIVQEILSAVIDGPRRWAGVTTTEGKWMIELSAVRSDKGAALDALRHQVGATAAIFLGDDVTDERAFARLTGPDVGIKVGDGNSAADHRILDTNEVSRALAFLVEERKLWLFGEDAVPIERLSMLSNGQSVALLTPDARVTWMCHPEPDSAAVFADLLGGPRRRLGAGQRHLGGARPAAAPALLEGHVLGDTGPRGVRLATRYARDADPAWAPSREQIAAEVLDRGWNFQLGCFTTAYGSTDLDAATLHIGLCGMLPPDRRALRGHPHGDRGRAAQRLDRLSVQPRRRAARR